MIDLIGGQVPLMMDSLSSALPHIKSGRIRVIAITTSQRVPQLPDVPTIAESGYPGFEALGWAGIVVPAGTPRDIVEKLNAAIRNALDSPELRSSIIARGSIPDPRTPAGYAEFIRAETIKWAQVAKEARVRFQE
jgi:tripartite-type tricarboxylate transporter receptor subunit TctC